MRHFKLGFMVLMLVFLLGGTAVAGDTIYAAKIVDSTDNEFILSGLYFYRNPDKRGFNGVISHNFKAQQGESSFRLDFSKTKTIQFAKPKREYESTLKANVILVNGHTSMLNIKDGNLILNGNNSDFGTSFEIRTNNIKSIEFLHDGTFKKCPLCHTTFYNTELTNCSFDKEELEKQ